VGAGAFMQRFYLALPAPLRTCSVWLNFPEYPLTLWM
jgi:hypothetical protein